MAVTEAFCGGIVVLTLGPQLPVRVPILPFESGRGFLIRVAEEIGYQRLDLTKLAAAPAHGGCKGEEIRRLARLCRIDPEELQGHFYDRGERSGTSRLFHGHEISPKFINVSAPRYCPLCLRDTPTWMSHWDLTLTTACHVHGISLVEGCPACGKDLSWRRASVGACSCGFELTSSPVKAASSHAMQIARLINRAMVGAMGEGVPAGEFCKELAELSLPSLLQAVHFMGAAFHPNARHLAQLFFRPTVLEEAKQVIEVAGDVFSCWPDRLIDHLRRVQTQYKVEQAYEKKLMHAFGNHYRHVFTVLAGSEFDFLKEVFEEFICEEWDGLIRGQHRWFSSRLRDRQRLITAAQATKIVGNTSVKTIRRLAKEGVLKALVTSEGPRGRQEVWIDRKSVEDWAEESRKWMPRCDASDLLGVKYCSVMALADSELVKVKRGGLDGIVAGWSIDRASVERILEGFGRGGSDMVEYDARGSELIALQDAVPRFLGRDQGLPNVVRDVIEGTLWPVGRAGRFKGIRDYVFRRSDLTGYGVVGLEGTDRGLSVSEVVERLGISKAVVQTLARAGYFGELGKGLGRQGRLIHPERVEGFRRRYVMEPELAKRCGCSRLRIAKRLAARGVVGIPVHSSGTTYRLYERSDVPDLLTD